MVGWAGDAVQPHTKKRFLNASDLQDTWSKIIVSDKKKYRLAVDNREVIRYHEDPPEVCLRAESISHILNLFYLFSFRQSAGNMSIMAGNKP
jgi:hypothetical protein